MVFDRLSRSRQRARTTQVGIVANLYTIRDEDGNPTDVIENKILSSIEGVFGTVLPALLEDQPSLDFSERRLLAQFVALQFARSSRMRNLILDRADLHYRMDTVLNVGGAEAEQVDQFIAARFPNVSDGLKDQIRATAEDSSKPIIVSADEWVRSIPQAVRTGAEHLLSRSWYVWQSSEQSFVTSDNPVTLVGEIGVDLATAPMVVLPLSPSVALGLVGQDNGQLTTQIMPAEKTRWINDWVANQADRQVYYHPETDPIDETVISASPTTTFVNGIPVEPKQWSFDKLLDNFIPAIQQRRDLATEPITAAHKEADQQPTTNATGAGNTADELGP